MGQERIAEIRGLIARHKRWDHIFAIAGLVCLMVGIMTLLALFAELLIEGFPRLRAGFFTSFPSRNAEEAGILSAWVGTSLVMLVTAFAAVPEAQCYDLATLYQELLAQGALAAYEVGQRFYEIGSFAGLEETRQYLAKPSRLPRSTP